jgi:hypothetical protein
MPDVALAHCQPLTEHIQDWNTQEMRVDRENRIVLNVALTGPESTNGYRYSEQALIEGLPLYENRPVFLDHPHSHTQPHRRSTRDLVGSVVHVRYEDGRIRGDIRVVDTEAGRTFLALAESNGPAVGMSHVILAQKSPDGKVVEKIHEVVSVDAVVFPATTKSFHEQHQAGGAESLSEANARLTEERGRLEDHIAELKAELAELRSLREVETLLEEARLPAAAVTDVFRRQLLMAPSSEARRMLLEERRLVIESLSRSSILPLSQERRDDPSRFSTAPTDDQLIAALRRR